MILIVIITVLLAAAAGALADRIMFMRFHAGKLLIDRTDPEKDIYRLAFAVPLDRLPKMKKIILEIDADADLSREKQGL